MRITYETWNPAGESLAIVEKAAEICADYAAQGYDLTLRQLYYQFVARDLIANTQQSYKRLGDIVNKARMGGWLDWDYIVDRTRNLRGTSHWTDPSSVIDSAAYGYRIDKWTDQPVRVEVWVEKEALAGIIERAARRHDLNWFSCRGYVSQSEMWAAAQRIGRYIQAGQRVVILHLGDHDPSGIDMSRDIRDRLTGFIGTDLAGALGGYTPSEMLDLLADDEFDGEQPLEVRRIALTYDQVQQYSPPPNPAKLTDSRASSYLRLYGRESWELDALDPAVLEQLVTEGVESVQDVARYDGRVAQEAEERHVLARIASRYDDVAAYVGALS